MAEIKNVKAKARSIRISPQKLNLVASSIRGLKVDKAAAQLTFSKKRVATEVKKVLLSAVANAENNYNMDIDKLIVAEAYVGKSMVMKRFRAASKGRGNRILKPFSNLTIVVVEKAKEEAPKASKKGTAKVSAKKETTKAPKKAKKTTEAQEK